MEPRFLPLYNKGGLSPGFQLHVPHFSPDLSEWPLLSVFPTTCCLVLFRYSLRGWGFLCSSPLFFLGPQLNGPLAVEAFSSMHLRTLLASTHYPGTKWFPHFKALVTATSPISLPISVLVHLCCFSKRWNIMDWVVAFKEQKVIAQSLGG